MKRLRESGDRQVRVCPEQKKSFGGISLKREGSGGREIGKSFSQFPNNPISKWFDRFTILTKVDGFRYANSPIFLILLFSALCVLSSVLCEAGSVKEPNVAGAFYPQDAQELSSAVRGYLDNAGGVKVEGEPAVLIVPHAGYVYSGPVAAYGFKAIAGKSYETVVILAPTHYFPFHGASVYSQGAFRTPLGLLNVDTAAASSLLASGAGLVADEQTYFEREHSVEVELPFLQTVLKPGFKILPVLVGDMSYHECVRLASFLAVLSSGRNMLVVVSTDLSHYRTYREALDVDARTIASLAAFDTQGLWDAVAYTGWNVCGIRALAAGMEYAREIGAKEFFLLKQANSGDTSGGRDRVVGYLSAVLAFQPEGHGLQSVDERPSGEDSAHGRKKEKGVTGFNPWGSAKSQNDRPGSLAKPQESSVSQKDRGESMLTQPDKKRLLEIARETIAAHAEGRSLPVFHESGPGLNLTRGCFVTLREKGNLRGCIGVFSSDGPLYRTVQGMAVESSSHDYRFSPVRPQELQTITIEISVLSEPGLIDDWRKIRLGTDGVIVRRGFSSGVFLPQVATETGWGLETFLGELCSQKAGLTSDCYKDPATKIYTFQAEVFSEEEFAR